MCWACGFSSTRSTSTSRAYTGPGNLLGNLLCGVAGLLDAPSLPALNDIIADLLNLILGNLN